MHLQICCGSGCRAASLRLSNSQVKKANVTPLARLPHRRAHGPLHFRGLAQGVFWPVFLLQQRSILYTDTVVEKSPTGTFSTPERSGLQTVPRRRPSRLAPPMSTLKVDEVNSVLAEGGIIPYYSHSDDVVHRRGHKCGLSPDAREYALEALGFVNVRIKHTLSRTLRIEFRFCSIITTFSS